MSLHPESKRLLEQFRSWDWSTGPDVNIERLRKERVAKGSGLRVAPRPMRRVLDLQVAAPNREIPVRLYLPPGPPPIGSLVWLHGGGFVFGSIDSSDLVSRAIAAETGYVVASVEYRLAPEHPFPAGLEDAYSVLEWVTNGLGAFAPRTPVAVGGDSAGACLAASTALLARKLGGPPIDRQVLVYPMTAYGYQAGANEELHGVNYPPMEWIQWLWTLYLGDHDPLDPLASPLHEVSLGGLPSALVITSEFDTLRPEGEAYAGRLQDAGVTVEARRFDGMIHGFLGSSGVAELAEKAKEATSLIGSFLRAAALIAPGGPSQAGPGTHTSLGATKE